MIRYLLHVCLLLISLPSISQIQKTLDIQDFNTLENLFSPQPNQVLVINFWATWCAPCVKELPYFESITKTFKIEDVKVILVSLDFPQHYDSKLIPFIKKHQLKSKVIALNDTDANTWIPKVDQSWTGAIPATLLLSESKRRFYEQTFSSKSLQNELQSFLK